jgi:putative transposase
MAIPVLHEIKISYECRQYSAIFLYRTTAQSCSERSDEVSVLALDPGVRTFQSGFDNSGTFFKIGHYSIGGVISYAKGINKLQSQLSRCHLDSYENKQQRTQYKFKRRRLRRRAQRQQTRIQNRMQAAHWNIAHDLCSQYDEILIPRYCTF